MGSCWRRDTDDWTSSAVSKFELPGAGETARCLRMRARSRFPARGGLAAPVGPPSPGLAHARPSTKESGGCRACEPRASTPLDRCMAYRAGLAPADTCAPVLDVGTVLAPSQCPCPPSPRTGSQLQEGSRKSSWRALPPFCSCPQILFFSTLPPLRVTSRASVQGEREREGTTPLAAGCRKCIPRTNSNLIGERRARAGLGTWTTPWTWTAWSLQGGANRQTALTRKRCGRDHRRGPARRP